MLNNLFSYSQKTEVNNGPFLYDENGFEYITWGLEHINYGWQEIVKIEVHAKRIIFTSITLVIHFEREGQKFKLKISNGVEGWHSLLMHLKERFPEINNELNIYVKPLLFGNSHQVIYNR